MNARHLISNILQYSGANAVATMLRRNSLAVLCYHRVLDAGDPSRASMDPALVTSLHVFERQMEIISQRFHPITLSETLRWIDGQSTLPPHSVLITFDDGVADTYTNAFPVMRRLGIPGVVFLATGFIGTRERHWADAVHERVAARSGSQTAVRVVERLKTMPSTRRRECLQDMITTCDSIPNLTWDQVEEMARHGFEFGSHTRRHVILPHESEETIREELDASAEAIELRLRRRPVAFAYPDGQFDDRALRLVGESGCRLAVTCDEGFVSRRSRHLALPRLLMHDGVSATPAGCFSRAMFLTYLAGTIPRRYRRTRQ
jgi:peptidoglycan/xylan/chitin deacetylase (PgdA/CDA1 family)